MALCVPGLVLFYFRARRLLPILLAGRAPDGKASNGCLEGTRSIGMASLVCLVPSDDLAGRKTGSGVAAIRTTEVGYQQNHRRAEVALSASKHEHAKTTI